MDYLEYEEIDENGNENNKYNGSNMPSQEHYAKLSHQGFQENGYNQLAIVVSNLLNNIA